MSKRLNFDVLQSFKREKKVNLKSLNSSKQKKKDVVDKKKITDTKKNENLVSDSVIEVNSKINKKSETNPELAGWFPKNWEKHLDNIRTMRQSKTAPVDTMGCSECTDENADKPSRRFQILTSLMLSSQTKDQVTFAAMERLKAAGCTPQNIISLSDEHLGKLIYPVGFWKRKVQYLKKAANILIQDYNGDIPNNINDLSKLPGVGPKMAHLCMQTAWNEVTGIGVDTHVHRISNRLEWVPTPTKTPEKTRINLESWLPKNLWTEINHLLVGFGQEICLPRGPKCKECLNENICPFASKKYEF